MSSERTDGVLFVSKPLVAPWNDSGKNLPRSLARNIVRYKVHIMTGAQGSGLETGPYLKEERIFKRPGAFKTSMADYLGLFTRLLLKPDLKVPLYHFFFTPNTLSSTAARVIKRLKFTKRIVQNINSIPADLDRMKKLIFGHVNVVMSDHTARLLRDRGVKGISVIPPFIEPIDLASLNPGLYRNDERPVIIYPGDYEFSKGIYVMMDVIPLVLRKLDAQFVIACRNKTPRAAIIEKTIRNMAEVKKVSDRITFAGEVEDMHSLLAASDLVMLPVDSLYAKMDIPIVLLEGMYLGKPAIISDIEPLVELEPLRAAEFVNIEDPYAIAERVVELLTDRKRYEQMSENATRGVKANYLADVVAPRYEEMYDTLLGKSAATELNDEHFE